MQQQNIQCYNTRATLGLHKDQFYSRDDMTTAQGIIVKQKWSTCMLTLLMKIKNIMSPFSYERMCDGNSSQTKKSLKEINSHLEGLSVIQQFYILNSFNKKWASGQHRPLYFNKKTSPMLYFLTIYLFNKKVLFTHT